VKKWLDYGAKQKQKMEKDIKILAILEEYIVGNIGEKNQEKEKAGDIKWIEEQKEN